MQFPIKVAMLLLAVCQCTLSQPNKNQPKNQPGKPGVSPSTTAKPGSGQHQANPNVKVSDLPIVHGDAVRTGHIGSINAFIQHVDRQIAMGNTAPKGARPPQQSHQSDDDFDNFSDFGPDSGPSVSGPASRSGGPASRSSSMWDFGADSSAEPDAAFMRPRKGRAFLRQDGWIESRPGDVIDIPLQTASPDIPKDVIDYFEKSRQTDLKLVSAIERAENNEGRMALQREKKKYDAMWKKPIHSNHGQQQHERDHGAQVSSSFHKNLKNDFDNDLEEWAREERQKLKQQHEAQAGQSSGQAKSTPAPKPNAPKPKGK